jgi:hypothetical protein
VPVPVPWAGATNPLGHPTPSSAIGTRALRAATPCSPTQHSTARAHHQIRDERCIMLVEAGTRAGQTGFVKRNLCGGQPTVRRRRRRQSIGIR